MLALLLASTRVLAGTAAPLLFQVGSSSRVLLWPEPMNLDLPLGLDCELRIVFNQDWTPHLQLLSEPCPSGAVNAIDDAMRRWDIALLNSPSFGPYPEALARLETGADGWRLVLPPGTLKGPVDGLPAPFVVRPSVETLRTPAPRAVGYSAAAPGNTKCRALVTVDPRGRPARIELQTCTGRAATATRRALGRWRFTPWVVDGVAQPWQFEYEVSFYKQKPVHERVRPR